jgi:hypothetical protein
MLLRCSQIAILINFPPHQTGKIPTLQSAFSTRETKSEILEQLWCYLKFVSFKLNRTLGAILVILLIISVQDPFLLSIATIKIFNSIEKPSNHPPSDVQQKNLPPTIQTK